jgi:tight adherence protein C
VNAFPVSAVLAGAAVTLGACSLAGIGAPDAVGLLAASRSAGSAPGGRTRSRSMSTKRRIGAGVGLSIGCLLPFPGVLLVPVLGVIGWRIPGMLDARAQRRRRRTIDGQIPQFLDLLAAASSAGLSGQLALRRAVEALSGPLADELSGALDAVDLGAPWRDELARTAERLGIDDLRRAVAALSRTETLGASLADSTRELADAVRSARRAAVTERARTAPVKMLFPLVFLVLPAFLLLTVVPVLLTTVQSIR